LSKRGSAEFGAEDDESIVQHPAAL
jgi:hypothetical protein